MKATPTQDPPPTEEQLRAWRAKSAETAKQAPPKVASIRVPPQDLDAEAAYLSWILGGGDPMHGLEPETFYSEANRRIYEAMVALDDGGDPIDAVMVAGKLRDANRLQQVGGSAYVAQLCDAVPSIAHPEAYVERIYDRYMLRQIVAALQVWIVEAQSGAVDWNTMMIRIREGIGNL